MRSREAVATLSLVAFSLVACSDGISPGGPIAGTLVLDFCAGEAPVFFAYQNEGGSWTRVIAGTDHTYSFDVTERVGIAVAFDFGNESLTDIYYATRTELEPLSEKACTDRVGTRSVNGSVADVLDDERAIVTMSGAEETVEPPPSTFTLANIADGLQDLVAHREINTLNGLEPDRVIVRRIQNPVNGATLPPLDFASSEAVDLAVNSLSITGLSIGETNYLDQYFGTASGTQHTLYLAPFFTTSPQTILGVPAALTQVGDLHRIDLQAEASSGTNYRTVRQWYRNPANKTAVLGASLNTPTISVVGSSPYLRMRASVQSQFDYTSFATAYFIQGTTVRRSVFVTQTAGYTGGTPGTWVMEIPNLSGAGGYPASLALANGQGTQWFVEGFNGAFSDFIGATPMEGALVRWAGRTSSVTMLRAGEPGSTRERRPAAIRQRALGR